VISLHDVTTEIVVALGGAGRLVGVEEPVDATPEVRAAIAGVPRVGGLETLVARDPDVVLGLDIVRQKDPSLVLSLEREQKSVYLPALVTLADVVAMIREVGRRIGASEPAERLALRFEDQVGPVAERPPHPPRVFVFDCCDPPFTAGRRMVLSDLIEHAGGDNIFGDRDGAWMHVSWEEVIARRPERIVVDEYRDGQGSDLEAKLEVVRRMPELRALPVTIMPLRNCLGGLGTAEGATILRRFLGGRT
jgi:iron complex transport system substrate-binding protein